MTVLALTAAWLTGLGIPAQAPQLVVEPMQNPDWIAFTQGGVIHAPAGEVAAWGRGEGVETLLHELAHVASYEAGERPVTPQEVAVEEGVAEAVADDLWIPWMRRFAPRGAQVASFSYDPQVEWLRGLSAMGCRCDPDSRDARRWRWRFVTGDRAAMTAEAMRVPVEGVE